MIMMKRLICMYAFLLCLVCVLPAQERGETENYCRPVMYMVITFHITSLQRSGRKSCTCICVGAKEPGGCIKETPIAG